MKHSYLDSPTSFKVFAHRGLIYADQKIVRDENTLEAFAAALGAGANYLELDVRATADGVAIVFHDEVLDRVSPESGPVNALTLSEIQAIKLNLGGRIPTLDEVLEEFPNSKINIDIKSAAAISSIAETLKNRKANQRVLITSFSERRRKAALQAAPGTATSPSAWFVLLIRLASFFRLGLNRLLAKFDMIQIPVSYGVLRLDSPRFIESVKRRQVEVVYWTVNDPIEAIRLRNIGASGIVTDRTDLMFAALNPQH